MSNTKTTTKKATTSGIKENKTHVVATIEKVHYTSQGKRLSREQPYRENPQTWKQFQQHGPTQGWFVLEVLEAPKGVDLSYTNPDGSGTDKSGKKK